MPASARIDACILRLLRLAFRRTRPLAAGAAPASVAGCAFRRSGSRGAQAQLHGRKHRWRTCISAHPGRASFERPYGLAWLLRLCAELREWQDPEAQQWLSVLKPLETEAAGRLKSWLPKLHYPIRIGEHDQTAFSFGLMWDWAGIAGDEQMRAALSDAARRFYIADRNCPLSYEPSGEDFSHPVLPRPISCAGCSHLRRSARGCRAFCLEFPRKPAFPG